MTRTTSRKILPYDKLDVMDIIKRWRELPSAQGKGRRAQRVAAPPVYPWKKAVLAD